MESRIVFIEESHHCPECYRLVCKLTLSDGVTENSACQCDEFQAEETELILIAEKSSDDSFEQTFIYS